MTIILPTSVGTPGAVIDGPALDANFTAISAGSAALTDENIRYNSVTARNINPYSVIPLLGQPVVARNVNVTTATYTGLTALAITHGAEPLLVGPLLIQPGSFMRVHWRQYIDSGTFAAKDLGDLTQFVLYWNIGAGYVVCPTQPDWKVGYYNWSNNGGGGTVGMFRDQDYCHNMAGSWVYQNSSNANVVVTGIKLYVIPATLNGADNIELGEGTLIAFVVAK
jgi:hypothetical protein